MKLYSIPLKNKLITLLFLFTGILQLSAQNDFTMKSIRAYPFPGELTSSADGNKVAWVFNKEGLRNIYVAEAPDFKARKLTSFSDDDGQDITSVSVSADGKWVVYLRGGEHGSNWDDEVTINPHSLPEAPKVEMWSIPFAGGEPILLGDGAGPVISPKSDMVAYVKGKQIWVTPIGESEKGEKIFSMRGSNSSPVWSPDGNKLAFVSSRGDRAFIGIYESPEKGIVWAGPDFDRDFSPRWSPDSKKLVFVRRPGGGGEPETAVDLHHSAWKIMLYDTESDKTKMLWEAPKTLAGSLPRTHGGTNLHWADGRIVFLSYHDGWPHLYSMTEAGSEPLLLTPGDFMAEYISLSPDGKTLVFSGNTGPDQYDIDRRHIVKVSVDKADMKVITPGAGNEWAPLVVNGGKSVICISATAQLPPLPAILPANGGTIKRLAEEVVNADFPTKHLVTPEQVIFKSDDGLSIHGTVFNNKKIKGKKPAIVYIHGGPPRQMLLGWHYSSYYTNAYAVNQYLANQGFIVLSVNYRLGIGYGYDFHYPPHTGPRGGEEYKDVVAAGEWLAEQEEVDPQRIGVYGGSYGGYLTAMALGRDSRLFSVGVDIHGVHDRTINRTSDVLYPDSYERASDAEYAVDVAWKSSPIAYVDGWTSPVLIIHGDDDRNVPFSQSTDLVQRLRKKGVPMETLVIVDDSHHFMIHSNQLKVNNATVEYLLKHLKK
ncbi:MAG: peptidase S9 [Thalassobius sp.]|nr:peptidase S9 [Thalassovita sp.]